MSFLDKLGDFTGGFGEGLGETFLPAFEKGWDRQTKLMDKAEDRDYAEGRTAENRRYAEDLSESDRAYQEGSYLIRQYRSEGDIAGLYSYLENPNLDPRLNALAQQHLGGAMQVVENGIQSSLSSNAVLQEKTDLLYGNGTNYLQLSRLDYTPEDMANAVISLDAQRGDLNELYNSTNISEEQKNRVGVALEKLDTQIQGMNQKSRGFRSWITGRADSIAGLQNYTGTQYFDEEIDRLLETGHVGSQTALRLRRQNAIATVTRRLDEGDIAGAREIVNQQISGSGMRGVLEGLVETTISGTAEGSMATLISSAADGNSLIAFNEVYDFVVNPVSPLTDVNRVMLTSQISASSRKILERQRSNLGQAKKGAAQILSDRVDPYGGVVGADRADSMYQLYHDKLLNFLRNSPQSQEPPLEPWFFDRLDWEDRLRNGYGSGSIGEQYAVFLSDSMKAGALSREDATRRIETEEWLTVDDRINARDLFLREAPEVGTAVNPALSQFDLVSIPTTEGQTVLSGRFTEEDTMHVKQRIARALSGQRGTPSVQEVFDKIKAELNATKSLDSSYKVEAIRRIEALETAVQGWDSVSGGYDIYDTDHYEVIPQSPRPETAESLAISKGGNSVTNKSLATGQSTDYLTGTTSPRKNTIPVDTSGAF